MADNLDLNLDTEISDYFRSNLLALREAINANDLKKFGALNTGAERVAFLLSYPEAHYLPLEVENAELKDSTKTIKLKEEGNKFFGCGHFLKAMEKYSNAVLVAPQKDVSVLYGNRSAALYHLEKYELALVDVNEALKIGYPKELLYKLEDRRARCLLALKNHSKAMEAFKSALKSLDHAKVTPEKKQKLEADMRVMLAVMEKGRQLNENGKTNKNSSDEETVSKSKNLALPRMKDRNPLYPSFSKAVEIKNAGGDIGRHGVATRDIKPGEFIAVERPNTSFLLGEYRLTHCQLCTMKIIAPIPASCNTCSSIAYCSTNCRDEDAKSHFLECKILGPLWCSGASITCILAIKAIIQRPFDDLIKLKDKLEEKYEGSKIRPYKGTDYEALHGLMTHEDERTVEDIFHRTYIASWLLRLLKTTNYFPASVKTPDVSEVQLSEEELFIGQLILHNLQLMQFNAHEISELVKLKNDKTLARAKNVFIGGGVYPTVALLNHSCNPGVVRYFVGTTMIVRAVKTIRAGTEICDNYGPIFAEVPINERKRKLRIQYWFECNCEPCHNNWPLLVDIDPRILRDYNNLELSEIPRANHQELMFRCDTKSCQNILPVKTDTNEFMVPCTKCGQSTNILKGLKSLQDTDQLFRLASQNLEEGRHEQALKSYLEILKLLDENLALPVKDYHLCQQGVRLCFLTFGNIANI